MLIPVLSFTKSSTYSLFSASLKAVVATVSTCSNCNTAVLYHRVCPECGFYRGKLAVEKNLTA